MDNRFVIIGLLMLTVLANNAVRGQEVKSQEEQMISIQKKLQPLEGLFNWGVKRTEQSRDEQVKEIMDDRDSGKN